MLPSIDIAGVTIYEPMTTVTDYLITKAPARLKTIALLDKPARREVDFKADWTGFEIPDEFSPNMLEALSINSEVRCSLIASIMFSMLYVYFVRK